MLACAEFVGAPWWFWLMMFTWLAVGAARGAL